MPETIDWPLRNTARPRRYVLIFFLVLVAIIVLCASSLIAYWVDMLWFNSLGYAGVFWTTVRMEWTVFAIFATATFAILFGAFALLRRTHAADLPGTHTILVGGQPIDLPVEKVLGWLALGLSLLIALGTGAAMKAQWPTIALYFHAPRAAGVADPILGKPLGFYLFTLPMWDTVAGWLLTMAVLVSIMAALFLLVAGGGRAFTGRLSRAVSLPWRGVSFALGFLLLTFAFHAYIGRFELLFEHHTIFDGVSYTDAHVTLGGMLVVCVALLIGAAIAIFSGITKPSGGLLAAAVAPGIVCYLAVGIAGWYVTTFVVKPNQLDRERPYIADNIQMTRQAYGLDHFQQSEFPAETTVAAADPAANQATLDNIRLWDVQALQDTLRQVQEIRTYYDFPDIDIDRYKLNGTLREVMLAVRELNVDKLPESSRNWINDKLIYTHGYGITMNPVNGFTPEGLPTLYLSNMPVQSTVPGLSVTRPEDLLRRTHQHRRLREDPPAGIQLPQRTEQQSHYLPGHRWHPDGRFSAPRAAGLQPRRHRQGAVQRRYRRQQPSADAPQRHHSASARSPRFSPSIPIPTSWSATTAVSSGSSMASPPPTRTRTPRMPRWATAKSTTCATA